ncbi:MAG: hypothetical protein HQK53_10140 [Oligoflexia bacterium]|nr:hypothetical protein [Oligoflexia bacterium]
MKNNKTYRFTVALERVDYVLEGIIKFNPKLLHEDQYNNLRKKLILLDHSWAKIYDICALKNIILFIFLL